LCTDATGQPGPREDALARALAAVHETYSAALAVIEADLAAGQITGPQAQAAARCASAAYERDCGLARIAAETGWETWTGVGGLLYARRVKSSPPKVVRAADTDALGVEIARKETGR
jgi:hypothetical protein